MINIKDKTLRAVLFGDTVELEFPKTRSQRITFPMAKDGDKDRTYAYRKDDGFILTLIEMIEKLEARVEALEKSKIIKE